MYTADEHPPTPGVEEEFETLGGDFAAAMKDLGFRRTGEIYRHGAPGEEQVLFDVQRGQPLATNTFFVNVGIYPQKWLEFCAWDLGVDSVGDQPIGGSILHNRLRAPVDVASRWEDVNNVRHASSDRWIFSTPEEAAQCSRRWAMLTNNMLPQLQELLDPERLLEFPARPWQERGQLSVDGAVRRVFHAVFAADEHSPPPGVVERWRGFITRSDSESWTGCSIANLCPTDPNNSRDFWGRPPDELSLAKRDSRSCCQAERTTDCLKGFEPADTCVDSRPTSQCPSACLVSAGVS